MDVTKLKSKRFYSEERYHYLDNKDLVEQELKEFKVEIEEKFAVSKMRGYKFVRAEEPSQNSVSPQQLNREESLK